MHCRSVKNLCTLKRFLPSSKTVLGLGHHNQEIIFHFPVRFLFAVPGKQKTTKEDPQNLMKEDGVDILTNLWIRSFKSPRAPVTDLNTFLERYELWVLAYQNIYADVVGELPYRSKISKQVLNNLLSLRNAVLNSEFKWGLKGRYYIGSPINEIMDHPLTSEGLKKAMSKTPFQDKIVQEVLLMVLEPVFEPRFSQKSYAFRPKRNAHTALRLIRSNFAGHLWYVKGDLTSFYENVKPEFVMSCLGKVVKDDLVRGIVRSALFDGRRPVEAEPVKKKKKRGLIDYKGAKPDPYWLETFYEFAPEEAAEVPEWGFCGVLTPLLVNICLNELDHWMEERIEEFFLPSKEDVIWNDPSKKKGSYNPVWPEFVPTSGKDVSRKMDYIRYGAHFLIGMRCPRPSAFFMRNKLVDFCRDVYELSLFRDEFSVIHITKGIMFLDHVICRRIIFPTLRYTGITGEIVHKNSVGTILSVRASVTQCIKKFEKVGLIRGSGDITPMPLTRMYFAPQSHCNGQMNRFLETMLEWYKYADNRKHITRFCSYIIRGSLAKLYADKFKLRSRAKVFRTALSDLSRFIKDPRAKYSQLYCNVPTKEALMKVGLITTLQGIKYSRTYLIPTTDYSVFPCDWIPDHEKVLHEYVEGLSPKNLKALLRFVHRKEIITPQEYMSKLVWSFKVFGVVQDGRSPEMKSQVFNEIAESKDEDEQDEDHDYDEDEKFWG